MEFARFALSRDRLALIGLLAQGPSTTDEVVAALEIDRRDALEWIGLLAVEGLAAKDDEGRWRLVDAGLRSIAAQLPTAPPAAPRVLMGLTADEQDIIRRYASGNRLTDVPSKRSHRLVVLERLALEFEPGRRYAEREVNGILSLWHPDYARLRRALVDERFLDRDAGEYWRSGGRVPV